MPATGKSRKLSKEERAKLKQLELERKLRETEEERIRLEEEAEKMRIRMEEEARIRAEAAIQQEIDRKIQLNETTGILKGIEEKMAIIKYDLKEAREWTRLMKCDGLPDPSSVPELNRYLSLWKEDTESGYLDGCFRRTEEVVYIINELLVVIEETEADDKMLKHRHEIWLALQEAQIEKLDQATYNQLLDLRSHMDYETMISELGFTFILPESLAEKECVVRVMRTEYDHFSRFATTFKKPDVKHCYEPLIDYVEPESPVEESQEKPDAENETDDKEKTGTDEIEKEPEKEPEKEVPPDMVQTTPGELNLRRYRVQGGVYTMSLIVVPPQPRVVADCTITQVEEHATIQDMPWEAEYKPPPPPDASDQRRRDPDVVEREMKQLEMELQKLILIKVKLPDSVFWFEPPQMVLWDPERQIWCNDYFHDIKYNEDTCTIQVRSIRLGVMGLAMNRFANLPFQNWEVVPKDDKSISLTLYGCTVVAEFTVMEGKVAVASLQDGSKKVLSHLYGEAMEPKFLIETLRFYGINMFPDIDSYCYMDGLPLKHKPTEIHAYNCMSLLSSFLCFSWSRWNLLAGNTKIVFQMRTKGTIIEEGVGLPLVLVTPTKTAVLECTELSQSFSPTDRHDMQFYADLYQMAMGTFGEDIKKEIEKCSAHFIATVKFMLETASVLSYC